MIEVKGNMWDADVDAFVITTNGFVKKNGEAVMGRGCALEAKEKMPTLPKDLGAEIKKHGNIPHSFAYENEEGESITIYTLPVKHNWWEKADIKLIEDSLSELVWLLDGGGDFKVAMPRPGCGNGQLNWEDVKPILEKYLDDRFIVYDY